METQNFKLSLLTQNQSQKEILINENFVILDRLLHQYIKSLKFSSPDNIDDFNYLYIVANDASGIWQGKENQIAYFHNKVWCFVTPREGMLFYIYDEKAFHAFTHRGWEKILY